MLVSLATSDPVEIDQVGGKAASLIRLKQNGLEVPGGVVLTTLFFEPWLTEIQTSSEWRSAIEMVQSIGFRSPNLTQRADLALLCDSVKSLASRFPLNDNQRAQINEARTDLGAGMYAVRSSSPEEDLGGASFAGLYETALGVDPGLLTEAVRICFLSCLDERVLLYKAGRKFESLAPRIAVIVQRMVNSDISGVAFSLNPVTNDYDELLINASWGLGEALVTGDITPDTVVVNKVTDEIISYRVGDKGDDRPDEKCLTTEQIGELGDTVKRIESIYHEPVDVEWACVAGQLHLLQARPITAYIPLHEALQTAPGEPRHLYIDGYLTDGITMSGAISRMSGDAFTTIIKLYWQWMAGQSANETHLIDAGCRLDSSRMYIDISMFMHLIGKGEALAKQSETMNPMMAGIFTSPEIERYRPVRAPAHLRLFRLLRYLPGVLWRIRRAIAVLYGPIFRSDHFDASYQQTIREFNDWITQPVDESQSVSDCFKEALVRMGITIMDTSYPAFIYSYLMMFRIKVLIDGKSSEQLELVDALFGGHEDDMIVQMGLAIYDLSTLLPSSEFDDIDALTVKLQDRKLPEAFLVRWDEFVLLYGCRGPLEMELANPKYGEAPHLALRQMASVAAGGEEFNPHDMQHKQVARREQAYARLLEMLSPRKARRLKKYYAVCVRYAAARELFKHHIMQVYERLRRLLLHRANNFVLAGRLDHCDQIFEMTIDEVDRATQDTGFDIRATVEEKGAFDRKLQSQVRHFPMAIDSRGRILRSPLKFEEGALVGAAVSAGIARGPIKVLNDPFEKELLPGDILVAVTTDPGWTPLFIPAAAVILEVGGELQHGALVAREYGKPCVSGIQDVTQQFEDGQMVEVDGNAGVIRFID